MAKAGSALVVDASVGAAWFPPDEATAETDAALHATATDDVWVPAPLASGNLEPAARRTSRKRITAEKRRELVTGVAALSNKALQAAMLDAGVAAYRLA